MCQVVCMVYISIDIHSSICMSIQDSSCVLRKIKKLLGHSIFVTLLMKYEYKFYSALITDTIIKAFYIFYPFWQ